MTRHCSEETMLKKFESRMAMYILKFNKTNVRTLLSWPHTCFGTTRSNISRSSMGFCYTMRCWHSFEAPSLHYTLETSVNAAKEKRSFQFIPINIDEIYAHINLRFSTNIHKISYTKMCHIEWCTYSMIVHQITILLILLKLLNQSSKTNLVIV